MRSNPPIFSVVRDGARSAWWRLRPELAWSVPALGLAAAIAGIGQAGDLRASPERYLILHFAAFVAFLAAARGARALPAGKGGFLRIAAVAVVLRAVLLPASPTLSEDVYRYLWDGRVQLAGINPYRFAPDDPALASLRDAAWEPINHKEIPTIYPPLQQGLFRAVAAVSETVLAFRIAFCALDLVLLAALWRILAAAGSRPGSLALYAWNPLVVVEVAGSGHNEVLAGLFLALTLLALARGRPRLSAVGFGAAIAAKIWPLALAPALLRRLPLRRAWPAAALVAASFVPFAAAGPRLFAGLREYGERWQGNDFAFRGILAAVEAAAPTEMLKAGIAWLQARLGGTGRLDGLYYLTDPQHVARGIALALLGVVLLLLARRRDPAPRAMLLAVLALLLLSPTVHPWYLLWAAPLLPLSPSLGLLAWTALAPLSYAAPALSASGGGLTALLPWLEYLPVLGLLAVDVAIWRRGGAGSGPGRATGVE